MTVIATQRMIEKRLKPRVVYETPQYRVRMRIPLEGQFRRALLLSPVLKRKDLPTNSAVTVSLVQVRGISVTSTDDVACSVSYYSAETLSALGHSSAQAFNAFLDKGYISDTQAIQDLVGLPLCSATQSLLSVTSCPILTLTPEAPPNQSSLEAPKGFPTGVPYGVSVLRVKGETVEGPTTGPVAGTEVSSRDAYVVAGVLVIEGIALHKVSVLVDIGWSLHVDKETVAVSTTETISLQGETAQVMVVPVTPLVQRQTLDTIYALSAPMYEIEQRVVVMIKNTSPEPRTIMWRIVEPNLSESVNGIKVFPNKTVPQEPVFFTQESWLKDSIYTVAVSSKSVTLNRDGYLELSANSSAKRLEVLGIGHQVTKADSGISASQETQIWARPPANAVKQDSKESWIMPLGPAIVVQDPEGRMKDLSVRIEMQNILKEFPLLSETSLPEIGQVVSFEQGWTGSTFNTAIYCIPTLAMHKTSIPRFSTRTKWKLEAMDLTITVSGNSPIGRITPYVCPNDSFSQEGIYSEGEKEVGIWSDPAFKMNESFYMKNGFEQGSVIALTTNTPSTSIPLQSVAKKLFLVKTTQDPNDKTFVIEREEGEGTFWIPAMSDTTSDLEQIATALIYLKNGETVATHTITFKLNLRVAARRLG